MPTQAYSSTMPCTMVQGIVLLYACVGIVGLILGDVLMVLIDPRINFGKKEGGR